MKKIVDGDRVEIPPCGSCKYRRDVDIRMRLDSAGNKHWLWWCLKCSKCVVHKQKVFISKKQIDVWGLNIYDIEEVS